MSDSHYPHIHKRPVGRLTEDGELYLPPDQSEGAHPGGGMEDGTTSGTTGQVDFPGSEEPLDDKELPEE